MKLDNDEYIIENSIKNYSIQAQVFFKILIPVAIILTGYLTVVYIAEYC
jgi:hypothetical protein